MVLVLPPPPICFLILFFSHPTRSNFDLLRSLFFPFFSLCSRLKQTYQVQDDGKCDFVLSKELVYQAYLAMSTTHEDLAALPHLTRPVLGKMVKRAFPSVPSIRRGPRGRVKQLYVGLVPQTHHSTRAGLDGRAKRLKKKKKKMKKMDEEEDEEEEVGHLLLGPFSVVGSPTRHRSDNEEHGEDCDNDGDGDGELEENGIITTTTTTATTTDEEEQTRRCSLETTTSPTTSPTPPTSSSTTTRSGSSYCSGDRASPRSSLDSTIASPSSSSSSTTTTTSTFFFASSSPPPDIQPGPTYQGSEEAWNGGAIRHRNLPNQPRPRAKGADMTDWARRAERLGRYRVMVAQTSSAGEAPATTETRCRISVVEWVELIIPADLTPS